MDARQHDTAQAPATDAQARTASSTASAAHEAQRAQLDTRLLDVASVVRCDHEAQRRYVQHWANAWRGMTQPLKPHANAGETATSTTDARQHTGAGGTAQG